MEVYLLGGRFEVVYGQRPASAVVREDGKDERPRPE